MAITNLMRKNVLGLILGWVVRLRFPYLFLILATLFVINLFVPDVIPFADEIIMGLVTLLLGNFKKKPKTKQRITDTKIASNT